MLIDQMKFKEYMCSIKNDKFLFMNAKDVIAFIDSRSEKKVYFMNTSVNLSNSIILTSRTESVKMSWCQWYKRLAHLNMINIKHLINMNININVNVANSLKEKESSESICEVCVINKQNQFSSWIFYIKVIKVNELVHMNLINDDKISLIDEEFKYIATMIDDYNQYIITYLLKWKLNLKDILWNYLKLMKTWDILIHQLHSNNEDEYADHQIIELLKEHEIKWKSMISYNLS